ncbi:putative phage related protein [Roseibium sp. TrichSKD4]|uniref:phage tail assembly protein n=1 Tax=Roseibium sp. TrichSKD4 TaxID=744980 RepID=UPI0001E56F44|nr:phage tail assembly protein [Roseibium sp. TrichSKD4]EFO31327.1 putative phage related protein [Roseibium sp. TrichSKD4]
MQTETINLQHPITISGAEVSEIEIRRPKWRDIKGMQENTKGETSQVEQLVMALCSTPIGGGLTPDDIAELDVSDVTAISDKIEGFIKKSK